MLRKLRTALTVYREEGMSASIELLLKNISGYKNAIERARLKVNESIRAYHNNSVAYGPFKGMRLANNNWWGAEYVVAAKILGTYERQVVDLIKSYSRPDGVFVDIGAADGYFALGVLTGELFAKTYAFEISERGRAVLKQNAILNDVEEKIEIHGEASFKTLSDVISKHEWGVVLIDIEGAEFSFLDDDTLALLKNFDIIVEMHDPLLKNGVILRDQLLRRASKYFDVDFLNSSDIEISKYRELGKFKDNYRLLAFSEGRRVSMEWAVFKPKGLSIR